MWILGDSQNKQAAGTPADNGPLVRARRSAEVHCAVRCQLRRALKPVDRLVRPRRSLYPIPTDFSPECRVAR